MNAFTVTYWLYVGADADAPLLFFTGAIPFAPVAGMSIAVNPNDASHDSRLHLVDEVAWSAARPLHFEVTFKADDIESLAYRVMEGWQMYTDQDLDEVASGTLKSMPPPALPAHIENAPADAPRMAA